MTNAQVTVTGYNASESTVTINFTYDGARPSKDKVKEAIHSAFGDEPQGIQGSITNLKPHELKESVNTVILTGDWNNVDTDKSIEDNKSIDEIVKQFADGQHPVTLDLSACQGFVSKYVDVRDYYGTNDPRHANETIPKTGYAEGYTSDRLETDFTSLPVAQPGSVSTHDEELPVEINEHHEPVRVSYSYTVNNNTVNFPENAVENEEYDYSTDPNYSYPMDGDENSYFAYRDGKWWLYHPGWGGQRVEVLLGNPIYSYFNGVEDVTQNYNSNLRQDGDNWFYDYNTYDYTDENGVDHSDLSPGNLRDNNDGTYTYVYTVTTVIDPVCAFTIDKSYDNLEGIIFPVSDNFTFIPNELFKDATALKRVVLSNKIRAIGNKAFGAASNLEEINFPTSLEEIGYAAFKRTKITEADLKPCTKIQRIRFETFQDSPLTLATFPNMLREIQKEAYERTNIVDVDLSECHALRRIAGDAFNEAKQLKTVTLCSHEKIIRGTSEANGGDSHGAFHECTAIKRVEVVGCENTCVTECVCENRGFEWDITHYQTAAPSNVYDRVAELIYPNNLPPCEGSGYTSSFDFFEGDYKAGTMITQETLLCYYRQIPNQGYGEGKFVWMEEDPNNPGQMVKKEETRTVTADDRYIHNGWLEFIKTGSTTVVPKGEFLRTYSRTAGDGPCQLPNDITAYRAVDYKSNAVGWVLDKNRKTGTHYLKADATSDLTDDSNYVLITEETDPADYANRPLYSKVTTGGKLFLRPLVAKVAQYGGHEGYEGDNIDYFDSEEVYSKLANVPGGYSYVPEETGVVLYSRSLLEEAFLVLGGDFGTETVYKKFPHTGDRYEEGRLTSSNTDDDINMLQGSFGTGVPVAPVFPWVYKDKTNYTGGSYTNNKEYRNFAAVKVERNGGSVIEDRYRWKRLTPSKMKVNRAFASIPVNRFDNWNESVDQMPDFTIDDEVEPTGNNSNLMLISVFGDEEVNGETDGIEEIKTTDKVVVNANDNVWYTTQGVRVANPTKGVYIHNGKKVVIK